MDPFFQPELQMELLWPYIPEIQIPNYEMRHSAFAPYSRSNGGFSVEDSNSVANQRNMNKRMIEFLGVIRTATANNREPVSHYRHMINERHRRNKMRLNYTDLHALLPPGTKADKNSIVQTAASHLLNLQGLKEELQRQNDEMEATLARKIEKTEVAKINLPVVDPSSAIDSMIEVLKRLKAMDLKAKAIRSRFSNQEISMEIETSVCMYGE